MILGDTNVTELDGAMDTAAACRRATRRSAARCCCRPTPTSRSAAPRPARRRRSRRASPAGGRHGDLDRHGAADRPGRQRRRRRRSSRPSAWSSHAGVLPVAKSQDSPGPIGQTVTDAAAELGVLAGQGLHGRPVDDGAGRQEDRRHLQHDRAVPGGRQRARRRSARRPRSSRPAPPRRAAAVIPYEFHRDFGRVASSQAIADYNSANPVEGLKFGQSGHHGRAARRPTPNDLRDEPRQG